eukprot:CAMPEP_0174371558 /NCGR_PEP_ID=MMETSP0811_2-20130205/100202_1 /TAXON_ID=73025 ORGANISM="Eutreptiella gymnastica-like, Strain CCMP1594" /NCGR_SAMPLE_ID=MMETSP0811_2 /ASSEMBLY_ACC=CAM_ASM_000667 /LENGTH=122 /DNA_ID=CAMNT_0015518039 /DNA_START=48 /DNA_END=412 /DNA_ORIENTATION=+
MAANAILFDLSLTCPLDATEDTRLKCRVIRGVVAWWVHGLDGCGQAPGKYTWTDPLGRLPISKPWVAWRAILLGIKGNPTTWHGARTVRATPQWCVELHGNPQPYHRQEHRTGTLAFDAHLT